MAEIITAPINYAVIAGGNFVSGGTVVFGVENVKPDAANPATLKSVYLDSALLTEAQNPQPLNSSAVFDQSPNGVLYGADNDKYSIVIYDRNGAELSYIPSYNLSDANAALDAQQSASEAATSAGEAAASAANAKISEDAAEASLNEFVDQYWGAYATEPALSPIGNPATVGDLYFNTTDNSMKVYDGAVWGNVGSSVNGLRDEFSISNVAGQDTFLFTYDPDYVDVFYNGVKLLKGIEYDASSGTQVVLATPVKLSTDVINAVAYNNVDFIDMDEALVTARGTTEPRALADWHGLQEVVHDNVADAKADIKLSVGQKVKTAGYHAVGDGGGADYIVVVGGTGVDDGGSYHDIDNGNQLALQHGGEVHAKWFGVRGDCDLLFSSSGTPSGTDDTNRLRVACAYVQQLSVFNYARGTSNEYSLVFQPDMKIRVTGDNVLGTTLPRLTLSSTGTERLVRCNYRVKGNGCIFYWKVENQTDRFIESHETLVRQHYEDFTVLQSDMVVGDVKGVLYSNIANSGSNATTWHKFENVRTDLAGTGFVAATDTGYYRMFQYEGDNLGDKLLTENCEFRYFQTGFYTNNLEAVAQRIVKTGFYAYMDNAIFFHLITHGSSMTVENCDLLIKGEGQTLLKVEKNLALGGGVFGASDVITFQNNRTETEEGKKCTFVDANSGLINYSDGISTAGGLPHPDSVLFYAHTNAVLNVKSCVISGRVATGDYSDNSLFIERGYGIHMQYCQFISDPADSVGVYDGVTFTPYYKLASVDMKTKPIIVKDSNNVTCNWQTGVGDTTKRVIDFTYNTYSEDHYRDGRERITLFGLRGSPGFRYPQVLPGTDLITLPASSVVDSIEISYYNMFATVDELRVTIGSATHSITVDANSNYRSSYEMMPDNIIVCPSTVDSERTVVVTAMKLGVPVNVSLRLIVTLGIRPAYAYLDNTSLDEDGTSFKLSKERT